MEIHDRDRAGLPHAIEQARIGRSEGGVQQYVTEASKNKGRRNTAKMSVSLGPPCVVGIQACTSRANSSR